jgi:glutathione synthase/RimK-type ligase-like ATP-grasp enzyme
MGRHIRSKWAKTKAVASNSSIQAYIPVTKRMNKDSLRQMLEQHQMVYIKPNKGTFGNGVIRIERKHGKEKPYVYQSAETIKKFKGYEGMYKSIRKVTRRRKYLVQRGIHLLKYKGNRFDLRVMVQLSPKRKWEVTGVIGRVAHPKKIVTNYHNGGTLKPVKSLLGSYMSHKSKKPYIKKLKKLSLASAKAMAATFKGVTEIGVDVALDKELRPWILEVNTRPDPYIFRKLEDKKVFAKVIRYMRAAGRR